MGYLSRLLNARNSRSFKAIFLAVLVAVSVIFVNEFGQRNARLSVDQMIEILNTRSKLDELLRFMIDAETGERGYLLTGNKEYLEPYQIAVVQIGKTVDAIRDDYNRDSNQVGSFIKLARNVQKKLTELEITIRLRDSGNEAAWKGILASSLGKELMDEIRSDVDDLSGRVTVAYDQARAKLNWAMILSRLSLVLTTIAALVAFYYYLNTSQLYERDALAAQGRLREQRDRFGIQVVESTAQLRELASYLQVVQETERGKLARDLHDELGSLLTAAKLDVARLRSHVGPAAGDALERIQHLSGVLDMVISVKRRIIEDLRPSSLAHLGLKTSVEILAREFEKSNSVKVDLDIEDVKLEPDAELTVYRLVQESLNNISKYAMAKAVHIALKHEPGTAYVEVVDDGVGFDPNAIVVFRHGLAGMRHRLEAAQGTLIVQSAPGKGTRIKGTLTVPLPTPD